ncbi:MAG: efflux RND transporter periplasmic adaptor subunit [Pirellulales bacterium]
MAGKKLEFTAAGYGDRRFTAQVAHTGNSVDEKTRAVRLIAVAENPDRVLKPGMFVQVSLPVGEKKRMVQVPAGAVQTQGADSFVFVVRGEEEFERRNVRLGRSSGEQIEVVSGVKPNETIVVAGGFALKSEMLKELLEE